MRNPTRTRFFSARPTRANVGRDPDYRFSLANERTFLAWIRTALALNAAGLAAASLLPELGFAWARELIGVALVVLGTAVAGASFRRWSRNQEAMRLDEPLPYSRIPLLLATGVGVLSLVAVALLLGGQVER